ncbi:hypothetical protein BDB01DRAFT_783972 [Pilobolus umbonatus]|nr:hypothetical protein BDB01DRAFT_783972 [Pilobolus umbonatus]
MLRVFPSFHYATRMNSQLRIVPSRSYLRPTLFALSSSTTIFIVAAMVHERETEVFWNHLKKRRDGPKWSNLMNLITDDKLFRADMWEERKKMWIERKERVMDRLHERLESYQSLPLLIKKACLSVMMSYLTLSEEEKTMTGLIGIHFLVFAASNIPRLRPFMTKWFIHHPMSGHSVTLLTSSFFHRDVIHFSINMIALWTVGPALYHVLGREQLIALYLSMGIGANLISHLIVTALKRPMISAVSSSGPIYGLLACLSYQYPEYPVVNPIMPSFPVNLSYVLPTFMCMDVIGLGLRWKRLDHIVSSNGREIGVDGLN